MPQATSRDTARQPTLSDEQVLALIERDATRVWSTQQVRSALPEPKPGPKQVAHTLQRLYAQFRIDRVGGGFALAKSAPPPQAVIAQLAPTLTRDPSIPDDRPDATHRDECDAWQGPSNWYQHQARTAHGVTGRHQWITASCSTVMCLRHVVVLQPLSLDYPRGVCVYCGLNAGSVDHLIPRGWSGEVARSGVLTVPSCHECNCAIGAKWAPTITERRTIAHDFLRRRYRRVLAGPRRTETELAEFGPNLRSMIAAHRDLREVTCARLGWPGTDLYDLEAAWRSGIDDPYAIGLLAEATA